VDQPEVRARREDSDPAYEILPGGKSLLQERLTTYGRIVPVVAAAYFPGFYITWSAQPGVSRQAVLAHIFSIWTLAVIAVHALPWLICRGAPLPQRSLAAIDLVYCSAVGLIYCGVLSSHPSPAIGILEAIPAISSVLGVRALIVPSTGARTALGGSLLSASPAILFLLRPDHFSTAWLGVRTTAPLFFTWSAVSIALTSVASRVLYGLRREVKNARRYGQYTLVERLGEGGMGKVYRAEHAMLRRSTAVKLLRDAMPESVARFEREVQLMAELSHPNTVAIHDYGRTAHGEFYYAMEYLEGVDLEGLVAVGGPQPAARVIHLLRQICGSLAEAHERGLIHRDVKPGNVFVCRQRSEPDLVKVLDFGLVKHVATPELALSNANAVLGTPLYMSPEAFLRPASVDARSDIYAVGALAYALLSGGPVFASTNAMEVAARHIHDAPQALAARLGHPVAEDLEALVLRCLAKQPSDRPRSARELLDALDHCEDARSWRKADADAWWQAHHELLEARRSQQRHSSEPGKTVLIDLARSELS
jgi:eukaryotic-like serine/threonine-protein kinase